MPINVLHVLTLHQNKSLATQHVTVAVRQDLLYG